MLYTNKTNMQWALDFKKIFSDVMERKASSETVYVTRDKRDDARAFAADNDSVQYVANKRGGRDYVIIE